MLEVVERTGGCVAWGGSLDLAPADDVLITVERPMNIDTEAQMIASIISKKKAAGATHALIDIPVGPTAKVESRHAALALGARFQAVAAAVGLELEIVITRADGPVGAGVGPRLEALDVLSVLRREPGAPSDLREKSLHLSARILEMMGAVAPAAGYRTAREVLDSGAALRKFEEIVAAQGPRELPPPAPYRGEVHARADGLLSAIDCRVVNTLAKLAGAPAHPSAGLRLLCKPGEVVERGQPIAELHAQSRAHLEHALASAESSPALFTIGY
jgi:thymidine phosphorylase